MFLLNKQIPFPKNYERFIELAQEAIQEEQPALALDYFKQAYCIQQDFSLNYLLVCSYLDLSQEKQALIVATEMKESYLSTFEYIDFYVQLLLKNHLFIQAHLIVNERILMERTGEMRLLVFMKNTIRQLEQAYKRAIEEQSQLVEDELARLGEFSYGEQVRIINKETFLTQVDFISISKENVIDQRVHPFVRSLLLEELVGLHVNEEIDFLWRNGEICKVIPTKVGTSDESGSYQRLLLFLEKELIYENPILLADLLEEIRLHATLLYPLADQMIDDPILWAISYMSHDERVKHYTLQQEEQEKLANINRLQNKLRLELSNLNE